MDKLIQANWNNDSAHSNPLKHQKLKLQNNSKSEDSKSNLSLPSIQNFKYSKSKFFNADFLLGFEDKNYNIKKILKSEIGEKFTTTVLKIALIKRQETIACTCVLEYNWRIEKSYLKMGIAGNMFLFLKFLWKTDQIYLSENEDSSSDMNLENSNHK